MGAAYGQRALAEGLVRYNLYLDCMPTDGLYELEFDQEMIGRLTGMAQAHLPAPPKARDVRELLAEVSLDAQRTMAALVMKYAADKAPAVATVLAVVPPPSLDALPPSHHRRAAAAAESAEAALLPFEARQRNLLFEPPLTSTEVVSVLLATQRLSVRAGGVRLFSLKVGRSQTLREFTDAHTQHSEVALDSLRSWPKEMGSAVRTGLTSGAGGAVVKGWYNTNESEMQS